MLLQSLKPVKRLQAGVLDGVLCLFLNVHIAHRLHVEAVLMAHHQGFERRQAAGECGGHQLGIC